MGQRKLKALGFSKFSELCGLDGKFADLLEFLLFVLFGLFVTFIFTHPATPQQSFTGGLGWTTLIIRYR